MIKIIKKNTDVLISLGAGILVAWIAFAAISGDLMMVDYATAATTADVTVTATVANSASLTIAGVASSVSVNGATTNVSTTDTTVALGTLSVSSNTIGASTLTMTTNATTGYTVNAKFNNNLRRTSSTTQDIDNTSSTNASPNTFPAAGEENFGYTTEDAVLGTGTAGRFTGGKWAAFTTGDLEVAWHNLPVSATTTKIGYQAGISSFTAPGVDYQTIVTYTMMVTF